jgi:hypothetical protein
VTPVAAFSVMDFLEAITAQLDQTQDALRLKAVNRPLTYAIRDFSMELRVFVELAPDGRVMFRPSADDSSGASIVHIGFTTVNRTMIDENTVSLTAVRSPTLEELGLDEQERRQLERLGVRNAAQLNQLKRTTGETAVARFSGLPVSRLRQALAQGRPSIHTVQPDPVPVTTAPADSAPPHRVPPEPDTAGDDGMPSPVRLPTGTRRVVIGGPRLDEAAQRARLGGHPRELQPVDGGVAVDLGDHPADGTLELDLGPDGTVSVGLEFEPDGGPAPTDPWRSS